MLLLILALCSVVRGAWHRPRWQKLMFQSNNFENLERLHSEITTRPDRYSTRDLNQVWSAFEKKCGGYKKAQNKWWDFLNSKVKEQLGAFKIIRALPEGRMGSPFEIKFLRGDFAGESFCLKLPSSFEGDVWELNIDEFALARDFTEDQEEHPCRSIIEHIAVEHAAGRGSYILLPLLGKDLRSARLSSDQAEIMMEDLLMACNNLHCDMKRVHGDLIDGNIMTTKDTERFVVIDVLSPNPRTKQYILKDLRCLKDKPLLCFKTDVKRVCENIQEAAEGRVDPRGPIGKHLFKRPPFSQKILKRTEFTVSSFRRLAAVLAENDWLKEVDEVDEDEVFDLLERIEDINRIREDISRRYNEVINTDQTEEEQAEALSKIAGQVLTQFFR